LAANARLGLVVLPGNGEVSQALHNGLTRPVAGAHQLLQLFPYAEGGPSGRDASFQPDGTIELRLTLTVNRFRHKLKSGKLPK